MRPAQQHRRCPVKLRGPAHWTWLGLRRVNSGVVARFKGAFYDGGRPFSSCFYPDLIEALIERNLIDVADPDEDGRQRVVLSEAAGPSTGRCVGAVVARRLRSRCPHLSAVHPQPACGDPSLIHSLCTVAAPLVWPRGVLDSP